jgi:hypothetical protein
MNQNSLPNLTRVLPAEGISAEAVRARMAALIAAGTDPIVAEKFAHDAEQQQAWHDNPDRRAGPQVVPMAEGEKLALDIHKAVRANPSKLVSDGAEPAQS